MEVGGGERYEVDWRQVIHHEILAVQTSMRRNSRWDINNLGGFHDGPLMKGFDELRTKLYSSSELSTGLLTSKGSVKISAPEVLSPFLELIRSGSTTGPITGTALSSIEKFLTYGLIDKLPNFETAIISIANGVTHCKFEATDAVSDEVVLMKILQVLRACLSNSCGKYLTDESVCEMMETCFSMCFQMRLSELLRRSAEYTLIDMVETLFQRLKFIEPDEHSSLPERKATMDFDISRGKDVPAGELPLSMEPSDTLPSSSNDLNGIETSESLEPVFGLDKPGGAGITVGVVNNTARPYGLPSVLELLSFLVNLLNPNDRHNTDTMRSLGLSVLVAAFEIAGHTMKKFSSILSLIRDDLAHHLFNLASTKEMKNPLLLSQTLRVIVCLLRVFREHLKPHQEHFLLIAQKKIAEDQRITPNEHKELFLQSILQLASNPVFMIDLYVNYDCVSHSSNALEELMKFLSKNTFPETGSVSILNTLSLEILSTFINHISERCDHKDPIHTEYTLPDPEEIIQRKEKKNIIFEGIKIFNDNPKKGMDFLCKNNIIRSLEDGEAIAHFLRTTPTLSKKQIGIYIAIPANQHVLTAFISTFHFAKKRIDEALRMLLESFRLPGESQQIERIMEAFASGYFALKPDHLVNQDAAFILSYSIIMLNTDQHNPQVKERMKLENFTRNNKDINGGTSLPLDYQAEIFYSIKKNEIKMPEEQEGEVSEAYAWKEMLKLDEMIRSSPIPVNTKLYDKEIFQVCWKPCISAMSYTLESCDLDELRLKSLYGVQKLAYVAAHYRVPSTLDHAVVSISKATGLLNYLAEERSIILTFGSNEIQQTAASALFFTARQHGHSIRESWINVLDCLKILFKNGLLPESLLQMEDFIVGTFSYHVGKETKSNNVRKDSSLFSAFSSLLYTYDSQDEIETADYKKCFQKGQECIKNCKLEEIFSESRFLQEDSLSFFLKSLILCSHIPTSRKSPQNSVSENYFAHEKDPSQKWNLSTKSDLQYDLDVAPLFLEFIVNIIMQNKDRSGILWKMFHSHIEGIVNNPQQKKILPERAVVGLLRLCIRLLHKEEEVVQNLFGTLELLLKIKPPIMYYIAPQMAAGLLSLIKTTITHVKNQNHWKIIFTLLNQTVDNPEAAEYTLSSVIFLTSNTNALNIQDIPFIEVVDLLLKFVATSARQQQQQQQQQQPQPQSSSDSNPVTRALKSLEILFQLHTQVLSLTEGGDGSNNIVSSPVENLWSGYWLPILSGIGSNCCHPIPEVRQHSLSLLSRGMLLSDLNLLTPRELYLCFDKVIFPLLEDLLNPSIFNSDPKGVEAARMHASGLLCKLFLQYLNKLLGLNDFVTLWLRILDFIGQYIHANNSVILKESVPESLKNMLLVMSTSGVLVDPSQAKQNENSPLDTDDLDLWEITWNKIGKFSPNLQEELFPKVTLEQPQ